MASATPADFEMRKLIAFVPVMPMAYSARAGIAGSDKR